MYGGKKNVTCYECGYIFCFKCEEKHKKITCKKYKKWKNKNNNSDKLLKKIYQEKKNINVVLIAKFSSAKKMDAII